MTSEVSRYWTIALAAVVAHCLLWWIGTSLALGNVHIDTSEIAYWSRDLEFGYPKHPPLASWIAAAALGFGPSPIVALLAIGQACIAVAAAYVWATIRLFASQQAAMVGVLVLLASPAATLYAVQLNHNTVLLPFWAATLFYAARYLEGGRPWHGVALGLAAGLGFLSKYEILVLIASILGAAWAHPPYRHRLLRWNTLLPVVLFSIVVAPHIDWLLHHRATSVEHATLGRKLRHLADVGFDIYAFVLGQVLLLGTAFVTDRLLRRGTLPGARGFLGFRSLKGPGVPGPDILIAAALFGPILLMVAGSLVTWQTVKPLWVIPFTPSAAVWVGYRFGDAWMEAARRPAFVVRGLQALPLSALLVFLAVLGSSVLVARPIETYLADSHWLGRQAEDFWRAHDNRPLRWVLTDRPGLTNTSSLWMVDRPRVDYFTTELDPDQQDILSSGGVALLRNTDPAAAPIAGLCATDTMEVTVPVAGFGSKGYWAVTLAYLPPRGAMATQCPDPPATDEAPAPEPSPAGETPDAAQQP